MIFIIFLWIVSREQLYFSVSLRHNLLDGLFCFLILRWIVGHLGHGAVRQVRLLLRGLGVRQVVHGDGEEDVEEDVVTADEQEDEVDADQTAETLEMLEIIDIIIYNLDIIYIYLYAAICLDPIIHDYIPILSGQNLTKKRFKLNASSEMKRIFYNTSNFKFKSPKTCITSTFSALPCKQGK